MKALNKIIQLPLMERFRGLLPVVVDIETAGLDPERNAVLEIAIVILIQDASGFYRSEATFFEHVLPFPEALLDSKSLEFNKIDPFQPLRFALEEKQALINLFKPISEALKKQRCQRAVLVGHNAWFDLLFINAAIKRTQLKSPFHAFTCFDTATLAGFLYGQTVLAKAAQAAGIPFDAKEAHSAIYDAEVTARLFCKMLNSLKALSSTNLE